MNNRPGGNFILCDDVVDGPRVLNIAGRIHRFRPAKAMLDEIGFFRLLQIRRPRTRRRSDVEILQFVSSRSVARKEAANITDTMRERLLVEDPLLENDVEFDVTVMKLLGAIQEATENSCDHAYRDTDVPEVNRRWWATGAIDITKRHLNLIVYDQGKSIPASLPAWEKYPFVERTLARVERRLGAAVGPDHLDAYKMRLAMDVPRSSTEARHRGKGFQLFRRVVEESRDARLRILSRNGEFIYQKGSRPRLGALKTPLNGTLVEWDLWL